MFSTLIKLIFFSLATNQHIRRISKGSCNTEDWNNDAENPALHHRNKLHLKIYSNRKQLFEIVKIVHNITVFTTVWKEIALVIFIFYGMLWLGGWETFFSTSQCKNPHVVYFIQFLEISYTYLWCGCSRETKGTQEDQVFVVRSA